MADSFPKKELKFDYLSYLQQKKNQTEEEDLMIEMETLSILDKNGMPDLGYLEYLRVNGDWSERDILLWGYLSSISFLLSKLARVNQTEDGKINLMGQFRPYHVPDKGIRKGPPPIII